MSVTRGINEIKMNMKRNLKLKKNQQINITYSIILINPDKIYARKVRVKMKKSERKKRQANHQHLTTLGLGLHQFKYITI